MADARGGTLSSFSGEVRWQEDSLAGIRFWLSVAMVEARLRIAPRSLVCRFRSEERATRSVPGNGVFTVVCEARVREGSQAHPVRGGLTFPF